MDEMSGIIVEHVYKSFGMEQILTDVNLKISAGKIFGIVGNNGSGKTVLMKCICGFLQPDSGIIRVNGKIVGKECDFPEDLGVIIETPGFLPNLTGYQNLKILASLKGIIGKEEIREVLLRVGLDPDMRKPVGKYSLGMRQRLDIAVALAGNLPVVFVFIYAGIICELAVFSAIFTWISMVLGKKAGSAIACIMLTLLFLVSGTVIQSTLDQEEYYSPAYHVTESGEIEYDGELEPNPNYLPEGSRERAFYEFLLDFTPGGQIMQLSAIRLDNISHMMFYDIGWFVVMTGAGILMFRRKSLK